MERLPTWQFKLLGFVLATQRAPFEWSWQDCAVWALRAVDAMCGTSHASVIRGQYADLDGAVRYARSRGWTTLADACREFGGRPLGRMTAAGRGDVFLRAPTEEDVIGSLLVCIDSVRVAGTGTEGLVSFPLRAVVRSPQFTGYTIGMPPHG